MFTKTELLLPLVGGVFVVEALSVIIQVVSFKRTGRRVFLMAPIHHHFEMKAWSETKIMVRFWILAALCAGAAFVLFYLRFDQYQDVANVVSSVAALVSRAARPRPGGRRGALRHRGGRRARGARRDGACCTTASADARSLTVPAGVDAGARRARSGGAGGAAPTCW